MWSGDISRMGHLADRLDDLAKVPSRVSKKLSVAIYNEIQDEFDAGTDPYGDPWAPLAEATLDTGRHPPPLTDTSAMRSSLSVKPMASAGVSITIDHPAAPHQTGWRGPLSSGPARPILPARAELPDTWNDLIDDLVTKEFRKSLR